MAYTLKLSNGSILLSLPDQQLDNVSTSLTLIGKNVNSYGTALNDNFIRLMENFASGNFPNSPLVGQLWFDSTTQQIKVYTAYNEYKAVGIPAISDTQPLSFSPGDFWFDTTSYEMKFNVNSTSTVIIGSIPTPIRSSVSGTLLSFTVERSGVGEVGQIMRYGSGSSTGKGLVMPYSGKMILAVLTAIQITGTVTIDAFHNGSILPGYTLTGSASTSTDITQQITTTLTFNAGDHLGWHITSAPTAANCYEVNYYIIYD